jgi:pSer/pThr/pTyr-binding forkhead associated (FHA) protein
MEKQFAAKAPPAPAAPKPAAKATAGGRTPKFSLARVHSDGSMQQTYVLDRPGMTAGHAGDIALTDPSLAAQHVRFTQFSEQLFVEDLGSSGGVYIRLRGEHLLQEGDVFQIGQQWFRFLLEDGTRPSFGSFDQTVLLRSEHGAKKLRGVLVRMDAAEKESARYDLTEGETLLGRSRGDHTFPEDPYLSSRHAKVAFRNGKYYLEDVGSTNGTFLRIRKCAFAQEGDTLLIGKQPFRVLADTGTNSQ